MNFWKYILGFLTLISIAVWLAVFTYPDDKLHIIACDVGQGDAILATYGTTQILVDGGPDSSVVSCLGRHMPFWDRQVELLIVTHPQLDHFGGMVDVVRRYNVGQFLWNGQDANTEGWKTLRSELDNRKIPMNQLSSGYKIRYSNLHFDILHPDQDFIGRDINEYSIINTISFGEFDVLLTGDIMPPATDIAAPLVRPVEVLKVPHHGSKNGLTQLFLENAAPGLAVISVGEKNRYGHPSPETLQLLEESGIKILRTDRDGEVEVISDGKSWRFFRGYD